MTTEDHNEGEQDLLRKAGRRRFLGTAALAGLAGAALVGCKESATGAVNPATAAGTPKPVAAASDVGSKFEVAPGQLDDYYMLSSGGHSGDVRILGVPSV